jgi:hypothetical protein
VKQIFSINHVGSLPLREIRCRPASQHPSVHWKEAVVFGIPLILVMPVSVLHIELNQLEDDATPYFTPVATLEPSFLETGNTTV